MRESIDWPHSRLRSYAGTPRNRHALLTTVLAAQTVPMEMTTAPVHPAACQHEAGRRAQCQIAVSPDAAPDIQQRSRRPSPLQGLPLSRSSLGVTTCNTAGASSPRRRLLQAEPRAPTAGGRSYAPRLPDTPDRLPPRPRGRAERSHAASAAGGGRPARGNGVSVMRTARRRAKLPGVDKPQTLHVTIELKRSSDPPPGRLTSMTLPTRSRAG